MQIMDSVEQISPQEWMVEPSAIKIMEVLQSGEVEQKLALFVGGCVRNSLAKKPVNDVDIATLHKPDEVLRLLKQASLKVFSPGIEHGTVSAVIGNRSYEITSLRVDLETDGRRARVSYTKDWIEDAKRRDFTINAIFADVSGAIYDPVGGLNDLRDGKVRFIGKAQRRIEEDVLRLLRFFRFHSEFSSLPPDREALEACRQMAGSLSHLSAERVRDELLKLFVTDNAAQAMLLMFNNGILNKIFPEATAIKRLFSMVNVEKIANEYDPLRRLASCIVTDELGARAIGERLRLSNSDKLRLTKFFSQKSKLNIYSSKEKVLEALYRSGKSLCKDVVLLEWAQDSYRFPDQESEVQGQWEQLYNLVDSWERPTLPVAGSDCIALGIPEGPFLGNVLNQLESWWVSRGFNDDREACLKKLNDLIKTQ